MIKSKLFEDLIFNYILYKIIKLKIVNIVIKQKTVNICFKKMN